MRNNMNFHDAIRLVDGHDSIPHVYHEEYQNLICDDFFRDKVSEYIQDFFETNKYDDKFYEVYENITQNKGFNDDLEAVEFFIVLKVLLLNKETLECRR
jgi:hypothetical protein